MRIRGLTQGRPIIVRACVPIILARGNWYQRADFVAC